MIPARDSRRSFLQKGFGVAASASLTAIAPCGFPNILAAESPVLGHGAFRYRVVPGWGDLGASTPVNDCHGLVVDREGHLPLLTN